MDERKNIYITEETVFSADPDGIDWQLIGEFMTKEEQDDYSCNLEIINKGGKHSESHPIKINILKSMLDRAEKAGANYVAIDYNYDHVGYVVDGIKYAKSTEAEIEDEITRRLDREEINKLKRIKVLKKELKDLES